MQSCRPSQQAPKKINEKISAKIETSTKTGAHIKVFSTKQQARVSTQFLQISKHIIHFVMYSNRNSQQNLNGSECVIISDASNSQYAYDLSQYPPRNSLSQPNPFIPLEQFPNQFAPVNLQFQRTYPVDSQAASQGQQKTGSSFSYQGLMTTPQFSYENQIPNSSKSSRKRKKTSKKSETVHVPAPRRNWTGDEDIALTKAWLYVSVDADIGASQKSGTLWTRILETWRANMGVYDVTRNTNALGCRWGTIQASVNKFQGYYEQLERNPPSGTTPEDMKREALQMYMDLNDNQAFKFEHCWEIMKNNPKWCSLQLTKQGGSKKTKSVDDSSSPLSPSTMHGSTVGDDTNHEMENPNADGVKRPEGRKAAKEKKKRAAADKGMVYVLSNMQSTWEKQYNLLKEVELKKVRDQKEFELREQTIKSELELKERNQKFKEKTQKRKDQDRIMNKDLTNLAPALRQYYERVQANILKEWEMDEVFGSNRMKM